MGTCFCCRQNASVSFDNRLDDKKEMEQTANSPTTTSTQQPILSTSISDDKHQISQMLLCDTKTTQLCPKTKNILDILSIYHLFIHNYNQNEPEKNGNIGDLINNKFNEYTLATLRDEFHHLVSYHNTNTTFMTQLFNHLIQLNNDNNIETLTQINQKLAVDRQNEFYFGHKIDEDISMIQILNEIHDTCTDKPAHIVSHNNENDPEIDENNNDPEIDDVDNKNESNAMIDKLTANNAANTMDDMVNEQDKRKIGKLKTKNKIKLKSNKKKSGYTKSKTKDIDENEANEELTNEMHIDVKYNKDGKKKRKIGRLKKRKNGSKQQNEKYKAKNQKILNDASWMNKKHQKKSKHAVSESIQMLGNTKLVTQSSLKSELNVVNEDGFDLSTMDLDIDLEQLNTENQMQRKRGSKKVRTPSENSMFDQHYDVDIDVDVDADQ